MWTRCAPAGPLAVSGNCDAGRAGTAGPPEIAAAEGGATCGICAAATLGLLPRLRVCPSARGITITKARLSKNAPRRRYALMVVGCLFILDLSSYFFLIFFEDFPTKPPFDFPLVLKRTHRFSF